MTWGKALPLGLGQKPHSIKRKKKKWSRSPKTWLLVQTLPWLCSGQPVESLSLSFFIYRMGCHSLPLHRAGFYERDEQGPEFSHPPGHGEDGRAALLLFWLWVLMERLSLWTLPQPLSDLMRLPSWPALPGWVGPGVEPLHGSQALCSEQGWQTPRRSPAAGSGGLRSGLSRKLLASNDCHYEPTSGGEKM